MSKPLPAPADKMKGAVRTPLTMLRQMRLNFSLADVDEDGRRPLILDFRQQQMLELSSEQQRRLVRSIVKQTFKRFDALGYQRTHFRKHSIASATESMSVKKSSSMFG